MTPLTVTIVAPTILSNFAYSSALNSLIEKWSWLSIKVNPESVFHITTVFSPDIFENKVSIETDVLILSEIFEECVSIFYEILNSMSILYNGEVIPMIGIYEQERYVKSIISPHFNEYDSKELNMHFSLLFFAALDDYLTNKIKEIHA